MNRFFFGFIIQHSIKSYIIGFWLIIVIKNYEILKVITSTGLHSTNFRDGFWKFAWSAKFYNNDPKHGNQTPIEAEIMELKKINSKL